MNKKQKEVPVSSCERNMTSGLYKPNFKLKPYYRFADNALYDYYYKVIAITRGFSKIIY